MNHPTSPGSCLAFTMLALTLLAASLACAEATAPAPAAPPAASVTVTDSVLAGYQLVAGPIIVSGVEDDLSGISFNPETGTLFAIRNGDPRVFELNRDGRVLRAFDLAGLEDTEDLACLGDGRLAVIEERRRTLSVCTIPDGTNAAARPAGTLLIEPKKYGNLGLEGVTFDPAASRFYIVKEKEPRRLYAVPRTTRLDEESAVTQPWDIEARNFGLSDLSAISFVPENGHLLLLSDESRCIVECTTDGQEIGRLPLTTGSAGLKADLMQPEGLARDDRGRLYVTCEPNLLYIFAK
ncbi:MAG: SdiA-regulated domain-containing protein [Lentisphaerae bacterium]|nr:SdiA-regulated domain-containing protein [Lentisphaerota bacterium]